MTSNIILEEGKTNEVTVATSKVEEIKAKILGKISPPQPSGNWDAGPKDIKFIDLLRIKNWFLNIDGEIDAADRLKVWNIFNAGGVFNLKYNGTTYVVNFEKVQIIEIPTDDAGAGATTTEPETYTIKFSAHIGENL